MEVRSRWAENPIICQATANRMLLRYYRFHVLSDLKQKDTMILYYRLIIIY